MNAKYGRRPGSRPGFPVCLDAVIRDGAQLLAQTDSLPGGTDA